MSDWTGEDKAAFGAGCITLGLGMLIQVAICLGSIWVIVAIVKWAWYG